jgi:GNAT superfamily N-acetyltransferase
MAVAVKDLGLRAGHVASAGFIVAPQWRNKGLGRLFGATMLEYAKRLGYRSVIFNCGLL